MKQLLLRSLMLLLLAAGFAACSGENAWNCVQTAGDITQKEFSVSPFQKILVRSRVQLIIKEGPTQSVVVETGANLMNDIVVESLNNTLSVKNNNRCNLFREYGITKLIVTAPNINEIRNSSGLAVLSDGVLTYPLLTLISEDEENLEEYHIDGDFHIQFEGERLEVISSGISNFFLSGSAKEAEIQFFDGDSRLEGEDFLVEELVIFQRSTQQMIIHPTVSLVGEIRGYGDVIAVNRPLVVDVEEYFEGTLIFQE